MLLFSTTLLVLVGLISCEGANDGKKKGGLDSVKTASDCFLQFSKIPRQNCGGAMISTCESCSYERCAEKCFFEESDCQGFSYSKTNTPKCVIKSIRSCEKGADNYHTDSDFQFFTRVPTCNLLPSGTLYPSSNGCAFAEVSHSCNDMMDDCTTPDCKTEEGCRDGCLVDSKCHGAVFDPVDRVCSFWMGKNCTGIRAHYNVQYYEKYCGETLDKFEKKRLEKYKALASPRCPNVPRPTFGLTNGGSTEIGEVHTIFCLRNHRLRGPRQIICIKTEDQPEWVPYQSPDYTGPAHKMEDLDCVSEGMDMSAFAAANARKVDG